MPQDPESQRSTREIAEQQARKSALTMAGSIVRVATELMIMGLGVGDESAIEVLGTAPLITMLLPLVLSHIGPVATSDPKVCMVPCVALFVHFALVRKALDNKLFQHRLPTFDGKK